MNETHWTPDEYGTLNLYPGMRNAHLWVQGRRPYCDRGHWEWGWEGLPVRADVQPSYYFMHLETALGEIELWVKRLTAPQKTQASPTPCLPQTNHPEAVAHGWAWKPAGNSFAFQAGQGDDRVDLLLTPHQGPLGPYFELAATHVPHLDASDCFPRVYLNQDNAVREAEAFSVWRLLKIPAEIPGPLTEARERPRASYSPKRPAL